MVAIIRLLLFVALLVPLGVPATAQAHANLVASTPAADSVLDRPPQVVSARFTEPLVPRLSNIQVLDQQGQRVDKGDSAVTPADATQMAVSLPALSKGTYTVVWQTLSNVDGHAVRGSFLFSVGEPISGTASPPAEPPLLQHPAEPFLRWGELLGFAAFTGGLAFQALVLRPALDTGSAIGAASRRRVETLGRRLLWAGLAIGIGAAVPRLLLQLQGTGGLFSDAAPLSSVLSTIFGRVWVSRMLAALAAGLSLVLLAPRTTPGPFDRLALWLPLAFGMTALLTLSLSSHAAATAGIEAEAVVADFLHLVASAVWVGGLAHLALAVPTLLADKPAGGAALARLVPRFSVFASLSVGVVVFTGLYSGWAQVTTISAADTAYGVTLIAKVALVAVLLAFGAVNLLWVSPRLRTGTAGGAWLGRLVTAEVVLGAAILLAAGVLASLEPARQVASRQIAAQGKTLRFEEVVSNTNIAIVVSPSAVGRNRIEVTLKDAIGRPVANATSVAVKAAYQGADLGEAPQPAANLGGGLYALDGLTMAIAGVWQVEVAIQRPDAFDARTAFRFALAAPGAASSAAIAPDAPTGRFLFAVMVVLIGAVFIVVSVPLGGIWSSRGRLIAGPGIGALAIGSGLFFMPAAPAVPAGGLVNPYPSNAASLAAGERVYTEKCVVCHGVSGKGDGPGAAGLNPPPLDLTIHARLHPQGDLFRFIRDGVPGTAMPAWGGSLSEEEMWHLVNYIRTLSSKPASST